MLAEVCAKCEHYIGTEGGGMDQAISFMANHGMVSFSDKCSGNLLSVMMACLNYASRNIFILRFAFLHINYV